MKRLFVPCTPSPASESGWLAGRRGSELGGRLPLVACLPIPLPSPAAVPHSLTHDDDDDLLIPSSPILFPYFINDCLLLLLFFFAGVPRCCARFLPLFHPLIRIIRSPSLRPSCASFPFSGDATRATERARARQPERGTERCRPSFGVRGK